MTASFLMARYTTMRTSNIWVAALALSSAFGTADAHHSRAIYDVSTTVTFKDAMVTDWRYSNPHTMLKVEVANESGGADEWTLEGGSPSFLARAGWQRNDLKVGDRITVEVHPARDRGKHGIFNKVTLANGRVLGHAGLTGKRELPANLPPAPAVPPQQDPLGGEGL